MLSRPFLALLLSIFVATMGISMVSPLLPVYAKDLGATKFWLGLTFSSFAITQAIVGPFIGRWSDRYARKPFIIGGLLIYMFAALGYLTADSFYQVILFRAFSGLGTSAIFSVSRAYVGEMTPPGHEGRWLGVFTMGDVVGFATGPIVAGVIRQWIGFQAVFVAMAIMMAISAAIELWWLPRKARPSKAHRREAARTQTSFRQALRERIVIALCLQTAIQSLGFGASFSFLALRLEDDVGASPLMIGLAFASQDLTAGVGQPFFGWIADHGNRRTLVTIGVAGNAVLLFAMGAVSAYAAFVLIMIGMGAVGALGNTSAGAIQVVAGRRVGMGTLLGLNSTANGFGIVTGSVVGGLIADRLGLSSAFYFAAAMMALGGALFFALTAGLPVREDQYPIEPRPGRAEGDALGAGP